MRLITAHVKIMYTSLNYEAYHYCYRYIEYIIALLGAVIKCMGFALSQILKILNFDNHLASVLDEKTMHNYHYANFNLELTQ